MTINHLTKEKEIIFLTVRETLKSKTIELTKKSIHKIMSLEPDQKNDAFNRVNFLLNTVEMLSYDKVDLFFHGKFQDAVVKDFKENIEFFLKLSELNDYLEIYTVNFTSLLGTHNKSSHSKYKDQNDLKQIFTNTKRTYKELVSSSQKDAFKDFYITYTPKKIKFKIWKDKEPKPEQVNTDESVFNNKFITEAYSNTKRYISVEANKDGLFLISKNMEDKTKDIKVPITLSLIEKLEALLNGEVIETQEKTITPDAPKQSAPVKQPVAQPRQRPVDKAPTPAPAPVVKPVIEPEQVQDTEDYEEATDEEQDMLDQMDESDLPN